MSTLMYDEERTYEDGKQYADDEKLLVRFEIRAVKHEFKSKEAGRPIFEDCEYISIIIPGSRDIFTTPVDEHYKARFRKRYEDWKTREDKERISGTILSEVPWLTKSQIAELQYSNVYTIEQLANLSDTNASKFLGNHELRERAKRYVEAAKGEAPLIKMTAELAERDNQIEVLNRKVAELTAAFEKMSATDKKVTAAKA